MQVVVRVERDHEPTHVQALAAAATAVVTLLTDERFDEAVAVWEHGAIRKIVRRARGAGWDRAVDLGGVVVTVDGASALALPPAPTSPLPRRLVPLQVSGLDLGGDRPRGWAAADLAALRMAMTPVAELSTGKLAAQAGHAAHLALRGMTEERRARWVADGFPLSIAHPTSADWPAVATDALVEVHDAGYTEGGGAGLLTAVAWWDP